MMQFEERRKVLLGSLVAATVYRHRLEDTFLYPGAVGDLNSHYTVYAHLLSGAFGRGLQSAEGGLGVWSTSAVFLRMPGKSDLGCRANRA